MSLVIWTYIFGAATLFGLIVGVFSVWNGRMTRRELGEVIEKGDQRTHELLSRMNGRMDRIDGRMEQTAQFMEETDRRHMTLLERMDAHMQEMDRRHTELLSQVLRRVS